MEVELKMVRWLKGMEGSALGSDPVAITMSVSSYEERVLFLGPRSLAGRRTCLCHTPGLCH